MTAMATILALVPLAVQHSGGLIAASLATVVIGGLLSSTLLTLVVVPVIYSLLVGLRGRLTGGRGQAATRVTPDLVAQPGPLATERVALSTEV